MNIVQSGVNRRRQWMVYSDGQGIGDPNPEPLAILTLAPGVADSDALEILRLVAERVRSE